MSRVIRRTPAGDAAWKETPLPPADRQLLSDLREPVAEADLPALVDPSSLMLAGMIRRGWLRWETQAQAEDPAPDDGLTALERLQRRASPVETAQQEPALEVSPPDANDTPWPEDNHVSLQQAPPIPLPTAQEIEESLALFDQMMSPTKKA